MPENEQRDIYQTQTNLLTCENIVDYLWTKYDRTERDFKPEGATALQVSVERADLKSGEQILKTFSLTAEAKKHAGLRKSQDYDVDFVRFTTFGEKEKVLTQGELVVIYVPEKKWFLILLKDRDGSLRPVIKATQEKKLFQTYPTQTILYF